MTTEGENIELELKRVQLARERLALENDLRKRERGNSVRKAGEAVNVVASAAGRAGVATAKVGWKWLPSLFWCLLITTAIMVGLEWSDNQHRERERAKAESTRLDNCPSVKAQLAACNADPLLFCGSQQAEANWCTRNGQ